MTVDKPKGANAEKDQKNSSVIDLQSVTASNVKLTGDCYEKENGITGNHLDEAYDPFSNRETSHRTSDFGALVHLFKGSFGSGILAVPRAFQNSGLIFGLVGTVLVGILCAHCVSMLVKCSHLLSIRDKKPALSFEQTAEVAFKTGPKRIRKYSSIARFLLYENLLIRMGSVSELGKETKCLSTSLISPYEVPYSERNRVKKKDAQMFNENEIIVIFPTNR